MIGIRLLKTVALPCSRWTSECRYFSLCVRKWLPDVFGPVRKPACDATLSENTLVARPTIMKPVHLFHSSPSYCTEGGGSSSIHNHVQGLLAKRPAKKKASSTVDQEKDAVYQVIAYATAEEYYLEKLEEAVMEQGLYAVFRLPKDADDAVYVRAKYKVDQVPREIFFFREGCTVFWNMPDVERNEVLKFIQRYSDGVYSSSLIQHELEHIDYIHTEKPSSMMSGTIHIGPDSGEANNDIILEKYAFSNALSLSVKLGIWEASLDKFVESIEPVLEDLKAGKKIRMSKETVLRKTGELFTLRHLINLSSDLLDPSDFYWDREKLELLYQLAFNYLNIARRTKVMNEKLNHCCELTGLLSSHLSDKHHVRLEWMIILLIMVEVVFEIVHYVEKYTVQNVLIYNQTSTEELESNSKQR